MKFRPFLIGDVHLGRKFKNKDIPLDKRGFREKLLRIRFEQYIKTGIEEVQKGTCSCIVQLGDLFDSFCVSYEDLLYAYEQLDKFNDTKIDCYILAGNHDISKDTERVSALELLDLMFLRSTKTKYVHILITDTITAYDDDEVHILMPYSHQNNTVEGTKIFQDNEHKQYLYGHFDEPFPVEWQHQFEHVYTGHIHKPKTEGNITVVGSILPFTFAEDPTNTFMRTVTLDEYYEDLNNGVSEYRCYRIKLRDGEELPAERHCLQMSVYEEKKDISEEDISVDFETFDLEKLMHEALDDTGLFEEIYKLYSEYKMAEASE